LPALRAALILILWCLLRAVRPLAVSGTLRVWVPAPRVLVVLRRPAPVRLAAVALPMAVFAVYVVVLMIEGALTGVDLLQHHTIIVYWPK